ncbi:MAG: hypothetical protein ABIU05_06965 [Nitrospirales bacterium]
MNSSGVDLMRSAIMPPPNAWGDPREASKIKQSIATGTHDGRDLPHIGEGGFFDGHGVTLGTVIAHGGLSTDACANCATQCSTRLCVCFSTTTVSTPYSWPRTQRTIAATTKSGAWSGTLIVKGRALTCVATKRNLETTADKKESLSYDRAENREGDYKLHHPYELSQREFHGCVCILLRDLNALLDALEITDRSTNTS